MNLPSVSAYESRDVITQTPDSQIGFKPAPAACMGALFGRYPEHTNFEAGRTTDANLRDTSQMLQSELQIDKSVVPQFAFC